MNVFVVCGRCNTSALGHRCRLWRQDDSSCVCRVRPVEWTLVWDVSEEQPAIVSVVAPEESRALDELHTARLSTIPNHPVTRRLVNVHAIFTLLKSSPIWEQLRHPLPRQSLGPVDVIMFDPHVQLPPSRRARHSLGPTVSHQLHQQSPRCLHAQITMSFRRNAAL